MDRKGKKKSSEFEKKSKKDAVFNSTCTVTVILFLFMIMEYSKVINGNITFLGKYNRPLTVIFVIPVAAGWLAYNISQYRTLKKIINLLSSIFLTVVLLAIMLRIIWW